MISLSSKKQFRTINLCFVWIPAACFSSFLFALVHGNKQTFRLRVEVHGVKEEELGQGWSKSSFFQAESVELLGR